MDDSLTHYYSERFTNICDKEGKLQKCHITSVNQKGETITATEEYGKHGLMKRIQYGPAPADKIIWTNSYNSKGSPIKYERWEPGQYPEQTVIRYEYDGKGRMRKEKRTTERETNLMGEKLQMVSIDEKWYSKGRLDSTMSTQAGATPYRTRYEYKEDGKIIETWRYNNAAKKWQPDSFQQYDKPGGKIVRQKLQYER